MRALFITRKHPPSVGGMENLSFHLISGMRATSQLEVAAVTWGYSQRLLPLFLIIALVRGIVACLRGVDVIHIGDPVLSGIGLLLRSLFHVPVAITVHGLDMIYEFPPYRALVPRWVARYDRVIAISEAVFNTCLEYGVPRARCQVIHPGVDLPVISLTKTGAREFLAAELNRDLAGKRLIITVGRLVPRKGVGFFVADVLPHLTTQMPDYFFLVIGEGAERERILESARRLGLAEHVCLAGYLKPESLQNALVASDLFVAPNTRQPGDMEGFGLVVLEAAAVGCPVLVADIEGLRDTLPNGDFDCFVAAGDADGWAQRIQALFESPERLAAYGEMMRRHVAEHNSWSRMVDQYAEVLHGLASHD